MKKYLIADMNRNANDKSKTVITFENNGRITEGNSLFNMTPNGEVDILDVSSSIKSDNPMQSLFLHGQSNYGKNYRCKYTKRQRKLDTVRGIQTFDTPKKICDKLIINCVDEYVNGDDKTIVVLFNHDIVKALVDVGYNPDDIVFVSDGLNKFGWLHEQGIEVRMVGYNEGASIGEVLNKQLKAMKITNVHIISNPPYKNNLDLKILTDVFTNVKGIADAHIVHPAGYILANSGKLFEQDTAANKFVSKYADNIEKVELFNGNSIFGAKLSTAWAIVDFNFNKTTKGISVIDKMDNSSFYHAENLDEITWMGKKFNELGFKEVIDRVRSHIVLAGSVDSHNAHAGELTEFSLKIAEFTGSTTTVNENCLRPIKGDYFTMLCKDLSRNLVGKEYEVLGKEYFSRMHTHCWSFKTDLQRRNFVTFLKTKFARFMLALYKVNKHVDSGELAIIPWLNFNYVWDDKALVEEFGVTKEQWEFIDQFIEDYYEDWKYDTEQ